MRRSDWFPSLPAFSAHHLHKTGRVIIGQASGGKRHKSRLRGPLLHITDYSLSRVSIILHKKLGYPSSERALDRAPGKYRLYSIDVNGNNLLDLGPGCIGSYSNDGTQIVFAEYCTSAGNLYIMEANGNNRPLLAACQQPINSL